MDVLFIILSFILLIGGLVGCVLPILPGTPLSYCGLLLLHFTHQATFSISQLIVWFLLVVFLQIADYVTPLLGSKYSGGTSYGNRGCVAGTLIGLFFMPWGVIVGPFIGAVLGEILGGSNLRLALKAGIGSFVGFLLGTLLKVFVCIYFIYECIVAMI